MDAPLPALPHVTALDLSGTPVGPQAIASLRAGAPELKSLDVGMNPVRPKDLLPLAALEHLEDLSIGFTKTRDAELCALRGFKALKTLNVSGSKVRAKTEVKCLPGVMLFEPRRGVRFRGASRPGIRITTAPFGIGTVFVGVGTAHQYRVGSSVRALWFRSPSVEAEGTMPRTSTRVYHWRRCAASGAPAVAHHQLRPGRTLILEKVGSRNRFMSAPSGR